MTGSKPRKSKHGHTQRTNGKVRRTPTYMSWSKMLERCRPGHVAYEVYKNFDVDPRWLRFENFLEDMGERPLGTSLDRRDNTKGYDKANCRWATRREQQNNRKNTCLWNGIPATEWALTWGVDRTTAHRRIRRMKASE